MRALALSFVLLAGAPGQDPGSLIEQLRSDDVAERERAFRALERAGAAAEPLLKKATGSPDAEVALQAARLLLILDLERRFSPALKEAYPGLSRRIAFDESTQWTAAYVAAYESRSDASRRPRLKREDLEPLAAPSLQRTPDPELKAQVCRIAGEWGHRSAVPDLVRLLKEPNTDIARAALSALKEIEGRGAISLAVAEAPDSLLESCFDDLDDWDPAEFEPRLLGLTLKGTREQISMALDALSKLDSLELLNRLPALLIHPDRAVRLAALHTAAANPDPRQIAPVLRALADPDSKVRYAALRYASEHALPLRDADIEALAADPISDIRVWAMSFAGRIEGSGKFDLLIRGISDPERDVRFAAVSALGRLGKPEHAGVFKELMASSDPALRLAALEALAVILKRDAVPMLQEILTAEDRGLDERTAALQLLIHAGAAPGERELLGLIEKAPIGLASHAAYELAGSHPKSLTQVHIDRLVNEGEGGPTWVIIDTLARVRSAPVVPALLRYFDKGYSARMQAARALDLHSAEAGKALQALLTHENNQVRRMAAQVLGNWGREEARDDLAALLDDGDEYLPLAGLYALDRIGLGAHAPKVRALLKDDRTGVRSSAAEVLARHGDKESIPLLREWLDEAELRDEALEALFNLGDRDFTDKLADWLASDGGETVVRLIPLLRPPRALPILVDQLSDLDSSRRERAVELIGLWGDATQAPKLLPLLGDPAIADTAVDAIVALKARDLIPDLVTMLGHRRVTNRISAVDALAGLDASPAAPAVRKLFHDPESAVRRAAVSAAGDLRDATAVRDLIKLLQDPSGCVRAAAAGSLGQLKAAEAGPALMARLDDPSEMVRRTARSALVALKFPEFRAEAVRRFRESGRSSERHEYLELLSDVHATEAVPDLIALLGDESLKVTACFELAELGAKEAVPAIARSNLYRESAGEARFRLGDRTAVESWLAGEDLDLRLRAAHLLCTVGDRRSVPGVLQKALERSRTFPYEFSDS